MADEDPYLRATDENIRDNEKRMEEEGRAEQNERQLSRGLGAEGRSARADVHHRAMQNYAESAMEYRRGRKRREAQLTGRKRRD